MNHEKKFLTIEYFGTKRTSKNPCTEFHFIAKLLAVHDKQTYQRDFIVSRKSNKLKQIVQSEPHTAHWLPENKGSLYLFDIPGTSLYSLHVSDVRTRHTFIIHFIFYIGGACFTVT